MGLSDIDVLNINSRDEANLDENAERIINSGGFYGRGSTENNKYSWGTKAYLALYEAYSKGVVVIGTSAGASVMSNTMVVEGRDNEPARKCTLKMAPGLGFLGEAIVDQHFGQRGE